MTTTPTGIDWHHWLERWDAQQGGYLPAREERFAAMIDIVEAVCGEAPAVLDLAAGPGSMSARLLARLPAARAVAADVDPVLLAMGRAALGSAGGRLAWAETDLRRADWTATLPQPSYDAVVTTTALHWLAPGDLLRVYADVADLLRPGGVLVNGDHFGFPPHQPTLRQVVQRVRERRAQRTEAPAETWSQWWEALGREPGAAPLLARRSALAHERHHGPVPPLAALHEAALAAAGFAESALLWSDLDDRVLVGIR